MSLNNTYSFTIDITPDLLDLEKVLDSGQVFRWRKTKEGIYVPVMGYVSLLSQTTTQLTIAHNGPNDNFWKTYLDLNRDYAKLYQRFQALNSPLVTQSLEIAKGIRCPQQSFFESGIVGITTQNNNIPKISSSLEKLCGGERETFPSPEQILKTLEKDTCSLGYRVDYIKEFCVRYMSGAFDDLEKLCPLQRAFDNLSPVFNKPTYKEIEKRLTAERGIGPKVAAIIALFSLGYVEAIPRDVWIKRAEEKGVVWDSEFAGIEQQFVFYATTHGLFDN